ncbi:hypothetical protein MJO28_000694 [Puccinia striiformis f. sp. tritici]|uniref:Uncharacterized protein n=2 Tax=Puccinia striiformis f. sp. tritici TaxID=168172 RepID=A0A0L0V249_9BASI|nr:hypothetical protein MJO28_000694 [Puccinia striiformis f. sp. tritici]KAI7967278.1 hypothetical protein MJO29_000555 [Puccinia striiformis f. sp. tritici]KAI9602048.1 hypothetical protein KEM48_000994 [Puccinia striiformis f. sp. tritici PST-130]KNE93372.1 hypothetical protein PSTG_13194 [Puccinia striiformis f. sp. tritici PST-78]
MSFPPHQWQTQQINNWPSQASQGSQHPPPGIQEELQSPPPRFSNHGNCQPQGVQDPAGFNYQFNNLPPGINNSTSDFQNQHAVFENQSLGFQNQSFGSQNPPFAAQHHPFAFPNQPVGIQNQNCQMAFQNQPVGFQNQPPGRSQQLPVHYTMLTESPLRHSPQSILVQCSAPPAERSTAAPNANKRLGSPISAPNVEVNKTVKRRQLHQTTIPPLSPPSDKEDQEEDEEQESDIRDDSEQDIDLNQFTFNGQSATDRACNRNDSSLPSQSTTLSSEPATHLSNSESISDSRVDCQITSFTSESALHDEVDRQPSSLNSATVLNNEVDCQSPKINSESMSDSRVNRQLSSFTSEPVLDNEVNHDLLQSMFKLNKDQQKLAHDMMKLSKVNREGAMYYLLASLKSNNDAPEKFDFKDPVKNDIKLFIQTSLWECMVGTYSLENDPESDVLIPNSLIRMTIKFIADKPEHYKKAHLPPGFLAGESGATKKVRELTSSLVSDLKCVLRNCFKSTTCINLMLLCNDLNTFHDRLHKDFNKETKVQAHVMTRFGYLRLETARYVKQGPQVTGAQWVEVDRWLRHLDKQSADYRIAWAALIITRDKHYFGSGDKKETDLPTNISYLPTEKEINSQMAKNRGHPHQPLDSSLHAEQG